jgi:hypothetical protein
VAVLDRHRRDRERERREPEPGGEAAAGGVGDAALSVEVLRALGVRHPGVGLQGGCLGPARALHLLLHREVVPLGVPQVQLGQLAGQRLGRRQAGVLVPLGDTGQRDRLVDQAIQGRAREIGGGRRGGAGGGEDAEGAAVLPGVLQRLDLAEPDLDGLELLLHQEGIRFDRALGARPPEKVLDLVQHALRLPCRPR